MYSLCGIYQLAKSPQHCPYIESILFCKDNPNGYPNEFYLLDLFNFEMLCKQYYNVPVLPTNTTRVAEIFAIKSNTLRQLDEMSYMVWLNNMKLDRKFHILTGKKSLDTTYKIASHTQLLPPEVLFAYYPL